MTETYITKCKRCDSQTVHYKNGTCKPCKLAYRKAYLKRPENLAKHRACNRAYMRKVYAARDLVKKLGLSLEGEKE